MIDAGVVVAYLGAAVARGGKRLLDTAVDAGLDRLSGAVARRLGREPESDLARDPRSPAVQAHVAREIEAAALRDPAFARALTALVAQLDRSGGRRLINSVRAQVNVQAFDGGYAHYGDYYEGDVYANDYDPGDELVARPGHRAVRRDHRADGDARRVPRRRRGDLRRVPERQPRIVTARPRDRAGHPAAARGLPGLPVRRDRLRPGHLGVQSRSQAPRAADAPQASGPGWPGPLKDRQTRRACSPGRGCSTTATPVRPTPSTLRR